MNIQQRLTAEICSIKHQYNHKNTRSNFRKTHFHNLQHELCFSFTEKWRSEEKSWRRCAIICSVFKSWDIRWICCRATVSLEVHLKPGVEPLQSAACNQPGSARMIWILFERSGRGSNPRSRPVKESAPRMWTFMFWALCSAHWEFTQLHLSLVSVLWRRWTYDLICFRHRNLV